MKFRENISKEEFMKIMLLWNNKNYSDREKANKLRDMFIKFKKEFGIHNEYDED
jgi:hypothetical protein